MDIKHPRRILVIGGPGSGALDVIKDLTESTPPLNADGSTAGVTHEWDIQTAYYTAKVPIWVDEMQDAEEWQTEFLKPEAQEVVEAVGAWIYCFKQSTDESVKQAVRKGLQSIQAVTEEHIGYAADTVMLAIAVPSGKSIATSAPPDHGEWEDICIEYGFEYVDYSAKGTNEFREKTGFERVKESLEANEWSATTTTHEEDDLEWDFDADEDSLGFTRNEAEMTAELFGMKAALVDPNVDVEAEDSLPLEEQASQVDGLDRLLGKLLAVKENSVDLPEAQRKRMAAQAVKEIMKDGG